MRRSSDQQWGVVNLARAVVVLLSAWVVVAQPASAARLHLSPHVQARLPDSLRQSLQRVVATFTQHTTRMPEAQLYSEQVRLLQESLVEAESFAFGSFSYSFRGGRGGQASGDFIDTTPLSDGRLLIRFGDVMGHDRSAATTSFMLQKIMRSPAVAPLLDAVYRGQRGLIDALGVLETVVQQGDLTSFSYYTLTSTLVDPVKKTLGTLFAGSDAFYLLRNTDTELPTVEKIHREAASTVFVSLRTAVISAFEIAAKAEPYTVNYQSGDILVYVSDGLLDRRMIAAETDADDLRTGLPRLLISAVLLNRDRDFSKNFAPYLHRVITRISTAAESDDCSILAIKLH